MPRKNVPGGKKTPAKPLFSEENDSNSRRKRPKKKPKYKAWLDEIDDDEDFDIFDREPDDVEGFTESE